MDLDSLDCSVCLNTYVLNRYRPRTLTCGHTLCTECVSKMIIMDLSICESKLLPCSICQQYHERLVKSVSDIPINFTVQEIIQ